MAPASAAKERSLSLRDNMVSSLCTQDAAGRLTEKHKIIRDAFVALTLIKPESYILAGHMATGAAGRRAIGFTRN